MGRFGSLGQARISKSLYFEPGSYRVKILQVLFKPNRKKLDRWIIECEVLETDNKDRPVGCKPSQIIAMEQDAAWGNIKQFLGAIMGITEPDEYIPDNVDEYDSVPEAQEAFWDELAEMAVDKEQPLKGTEMLLTCTHTVTEAGNDFTKHWWTQPEEEAAA